MSVKRQAQTELNHENWDQEDPEENKEMGRFNTAPKEVLEKRIIKTAKRRSHATNDEAKKTIFSGFGGFNKTQPSSFDFLAKLTNGAKTSVSPTSTETKVTSSLFSSTPTNNIGGIFSSTPAVKSTDTTSGLATNNITGSPVSSFNFSSTSSDSPGKVVSSFSFSATKVNPGIMAQGSSTTSSSTVTTSSASFSFSSSKINPPTNSSPFKVPSTPSTEETKMSNVFKTTNTGTASTLFSSTFNNANQSTSGNKSVFSPKNSNSTIFQSNNPFVATTTSTSTTATTTSSDSKNNDNKDESKQSKIKYYTQLKGLNLSVAEWIQKNVEATPVCILSPIFKDYENHLKEIQEEYFGTNKQNSENKTTDSDNNKTTTEVSKPSIFSSYTNTTSSSSPFLKSDNVTSKEPTLTTQSNINKPQTGFSFGINSIANSSNSGVSSTYTGFSFGNISTVTSAATSPIFSFGTKTGSPSDANKQLSLGVTSPISFSNFQKPADKPESKEDQEDEDCPPKVEHTPIAEENSVYEKRCKVFVKKEGNFVDKGVGTLYIKKIEDTEKFQLLVRANTALGNVLLNLRLSSSIPTQKMGKNNVMIVCIPTPEFKPPPTPVLIRVKTAEEADEVLETLNKHKS